jgi:hypothetical protein
MKVVSIPRSGATKFAMDLAKEQNKDYAGELSSRMCLDYDLQSIIKNQYHEAGDGCQPMYTIKEFMNTLAEHEIKNVWLVNDHNDVSPHLREGIFFLRKDYMKCFYSLGEVWIAQKKAGRVYWWSGVWEPYVRNLSLILDWNLQFPSEIYWYEDRYDFTREYNIDKNLVNQELSPWLEEYKIDEKMQELIEKG